MVNLQALHWVDNKQVKGYKEYLKIYGRKYFAHQSAEEAPMILVWVDDASNCLHYVLEL